MLGFWRNSGYHNFLPSLSDLYYLKRFYVLRTSLFPGSAAEAAEAGQRGQANSLRKAPPPPKKIKEFLDKFIVGK